MGSPPSPPPPPYAEKEPQPPDATSHRAPPGTQPLSPTPSGAYLSKLPASGTWLAPDPRSSSTQSLYPISPSETSLYSPSAPTDDPRGRRRLLVIYIHGFLGNDQSFRSFPAHVHALLTNLLADTHVIHSKIYPRYKTYRAVDVARDNFSEWLTPHESPTTDVILIGHSMGGILAADIILMPNQSPYGTYPFKHRILGHVSLDCPFLGLHPGIVVSGISSLFKPAAAPPQDQPQENAGSNAPYASGSSTVASPSDSSLFLTNSQSSVPGSPASPYSATSTPFPNLIHDDFFNQPFFNDSGLREQPFMRRMLHFASKYRSEGLVQAAARHVFSYLEFGSCLADLAGLESRYTRLRALEDVDELQPASSSQDPNGPTVRVRFLNYYTLSTGRPKTPKAETPEEGSSSQRESIDASNVTPGRTSLQPDSSLLRSKLEEHNNIRSSRESPRPSITVEHRDTMGNSTNHQTILDTSHKGQSNQAANDTYQDDQAHKRDSIDSGMNRMSMQFVDPTPIEDPIDDPSNPKSIDNSIPPTPQESSNPPRFSEDIDLPSLPEPPKAPELPDLSLYTDKDERKQAERESKRLQKAYEHAVKDHAKAGREREKLLEKRRKRAQKEADKALKEAARQEKETLKEAERKGKEAQKEQRRLEKEAMEREEKQRQQENHQQAADAEVVAGACDLDSSKPRKLRKFCNLPSNGGVVTDPTWVDIYMADVDEVGAHCGLFFPGAHYEKLVGDVGSRVMGWVQEDLTKRAIQEMGA
ncbi:hypothetical protein FZEAL_4997 [Fusarium zealandicum]|uniref:DUF676 domain-containing protein n=1 Tax=Fusarium zealandicum TaxID=1053134 RepID=A0A8H4XK76_9HYPO|nr:hypothetical protein FZEAL_4997 [Fusarium zealandicum]